MMRERCDSMVHRRDILKLTALLTDIACPWPVAAAARPKRVLVAGAGLAGLSCAWELSKKGPRCVGSRGVQPDRRPRAHRSRRTGGWVVRRWRCRALHPARL